MMDDRPVSLPDDRRTAIISPLWSAFVNDSVPPATASATARAALRVDRAATELRRGRPVFLLAGAEALVLAAVETVLPQTQSALPVIGANGVRLLLSGERAVAAGWVAESTHRPVSPEARPFAIALPSQVAAHDLALLGGLAVAEPGAPLRPEGYREDSAWLAEGDALALARSAVELARLARLVPALLVSRVSAEAARRALQDDDVLGVAQLDLTAFVAAEAAGLRRIAEAPVPLAGHESCRFVLFRETTADFEHVAILVGTPDPTAPMPVRIHSSCLTGDLFGSLRCDCGEQLRGGIARLEAEGGGVLLYLAQEGRGIGLANKLRAYARQDAGLDTIEADRYLGFRGDERRFAIAARMLRDLGVAQVRLLTNNPGKISALRAAGLDVVDRIPITGTVNRHHARYLATKRDKAGHLIDPDVQPGGPSS